MVDFLRIGLVQPVIDPNVCWGRAVPYQLNIDAISAERVWQEISDGLANMIKREDKPEIILIPELHLPQAKIAEIKRISKRHNIMIIAGVDFQRNPVDKNKIRNRGLITLPNNWGRSNFSSRISTLHFGKTYFTYMERKMFKDIEGEECYEDPEQNLYILRSNQFGSFGIVICSDIFDIERMMLYQARIHHLFIISLNMDLTTYFSMAETLTRLLYCNVIVCNSGEYGGSVVVSPYRDTNDRLIYRYHGQKMANSHVVAIPVDSLSKAQFQDYSSEKVNRKFKASPPGYYDKIIRFNDL